MHREVRLFGHGGVGEEIGSEDGYRGVEVGE